MSSRSIKRMRRSFKRLKRRIKKKRVPKKLRSKIGRKLFNKKPKHTNFVQRVKEAELKISRPKWKARNNFTNTQSGVTYFNAAYIFSLF